MDSYTPLDLAGQLGDGLADVMLWVGIAVAAGLALWFIFSGIRTGLGFFGGIVADGGNPVEGSYEEFKISGLSLDSWDALQRGEERMVYADGSDVVEEREPERSLWDEAHDGVVAASDLGPTDFSQRNEDYFQEKYAFAKEIGMTDDWEAAAWAADRVHDLKVVDAMPDGDYDPFGSPSEKGL